ncbi:MAG: tRNA 2-selenouridine(34) synthase MnmH [Planctomycetaceae bacterium]|nr:tRNA 2-selenouridine(34) synthase MnmH [Planctomycetaceae bacterium]
MEEPVERGAPSGAGRPGQTTGGAVPPPREITVREALALAGPAVDLRSPTEYAEDHLPGAQNVPLFDDAERALVGTLYRQVGQDQAHAQALELTRRNVTRLVERLVGPEAAQAADLDGRVRAIAQGGVAAMEQRLLARDRNAAPAGPHTRVLCCWRGGLRSRAVAALLEGLGFDVAVVRGGYKAYRHHVRERLAAFEPPPVFVLRGLTGVGKTLVLRAFERRWPGTTLDLEAMAGHRSSILGAVGLEPATQKSFESRLARRLELGFGAGFVLLEGESRKVGDLVVPDRVWQAMENGISIELEAPMAHRVRVLLDDYLATPGAREGLRPGLQFLEQRLGSVKYAGRLTGLLESGAEAELVELLLRLYYDPLYHHSESRHSVGTWVDAMDPDRAALAVHAWIARRLAH